MSDLHVTHPSSASSTVEQARDVRAHCWAFIFDCYAKKEVARAGDPNAGKEINERSGKAIIPK
jgi:hypothetical protein